MIEISKTSTTETVKVIKVRGARVILSDDCKEVTIDFQPIAKAISNVLIALKINRTYSCSDKTGTIKLYGTVSSLEEMEYKFKLIGDSLLLIEKTTYGVQTKHVEACI